MTNTPVQHGILRFAKEVQALAGGKPVAACTTAEWVRWGNEQKKKTANAA
jgi:hypothetical protein